MVFCSGGACFFFCQRWLADTRAPEALQPAWRMPPCSRDKSSLLSPGLSKPNRKVLHLIWCMFTHEGEGQE